MLKIGIIGLGDIAQKAYLPVISKKELEVHLYTRDHVKLQDVGSKYRYNNLHDSLDSIINADIQAAFVHTATASHEEIVTQLLNHNIHVFVDKPITYHFNTSEKLLALAGKKELILKVGFNRRYAPAIQNLKTLHDVNMIIMQKNRKFLPGDIRTFIFDDFIHVVDTLLYLSKHPIEQLIVTGKKKDNLLYHVVVQFVFAGGLTAIGIMNRDSGTNEEKVEVFTTEEKRIVCNVSDSFILKDKNVTKTGENDWMPTLTKRGFEGMVDEFLHDVKSGTRQYTEHDLLTHKVCEEIANTLEAL
ncbi:MAG TPA: Gfo/Idh/MocA family oxidoreductase [Cyclobacteriaceae bacterium]